LAVEVLRASSSDALRMTVWSMTSEHQALAMS
jgi:hypothetical protein